jgi:uncharacterized protein YuzE
MSFRKPQRAEKTIELDDDILVRKDGKEIVGLTIPNAGRQLDTEKTSAGKKSPAVLRVQALTVCEKTGAEFNRDASNCPTAE